ncbi:unnamed protein product [Chrysodeixis includens]|uniref:Uncharacterized protein n=1 Tax=Chrysodeixis includens TaxID=689277 RepID=A0A9N8L420_CHRIL|nr:unnamed protein product [Chrysodeixis includens]
MKYFLLIMLLLVYLTVQNNAIETSTYTTKYDAIDLDEVLGNDRLLTGYVKCLLEEGPCTADGKELKQNLPDAIENDCKKCSERQREGADKVIHYIIDHRPDDWTTLEKKYNPDGTYKVKYLASKHSEENEQDDSKSEKDPTNESKE